MRSLLLILLLLAPVAAQPSLSVTGNLYEGSALFLRVDNLQGDEAPRVEFEDAVYEFVRSGQSWETVLPLSIDSGGERSFTVTTSEGSFTRSITVKPRSYGYQSISISPDTLASYDNPQNKADDEAIIAALEGDRTATLFSGDFDYPVNAPESTGFGMKRTYNGWKKGWHKGLDLAAWEGEPVKAPAGAVVIHTARGIVNGNTVVLSHGAGVGSVYLHLNSIQVSPGQKLRRGQVLGTVGGTGGFAPHLHWEVRVHGEAVSPKTFFALPEGW